VEYGDQVFSFAGLSAWNSFSADLEKQTQSKTLEKHLNLATILCKFYWNFLLVTCRWMRRRRNSVIIFVFIAVPMILLCILLKFLYLLIALECHLWNDVVMIVIRQSQILSLKIHHFIFFHRICTWKLSHSKIEVLVRFQLMDNWLLISMFESWYVLVQLLKVLA